MKTAMRLVSKPGGAVERVYFFDGAIASRLPAKIKHPFVVATRNMQGRVVHRPAEAQTLWVDGRLMGTTARTVCNRWLSLVTAHLEAPEQFDLCDNCLMADWPGPCVYRLFDAYDNLLYIGCSISLFTRILTHVGGGALPWTSRIARWDYQVYPDHDSALHAEKVAIVNERPLHNRDLTDRAGNPGRRRARFTHLIVPTPAGAA